MKRILAIALLVPIFSFFGCPEELLDIKFKMNLASVTLKLMPQAEAGVYTLDTATFTSNLKAEATANGVDMSNIKSAKITKMTLTIVAPIGADFGAIDELIAQLGSPGFGPVFYTTYKPDGGGQAVTVIEMTPDDKNLLDLLSNEEIQLIAEVTTNKAVDEEVTVKVETELEIIANPV